MTNRPLFNTSQPGSVVEPSTTVRDQPQEKPTVKRGPLRTAVDEIPIIEMAKKFGWLTSPERRGNNYIKCPLPTHHHSHSSLKKAGKGSFTINTLKNTARCWKCGSFVYEDAASLLAAVRGERKQQVATLHLAHEFKLITEEVFQKALYQNYRVKASDIQKSDLFVPFQSLEIEKTPFNQLNIDRIYRCLMLTYRINATDASNDYPFLSQADFNYLHQGRNLSVDSIKKSQFFTFPQPHLFPSFVRVLKHNEIITSEKDLDGCLKGVPGFYYDCEKQTWTFKKKQGIAIPIKNADGFIVGLQVRNTDEEMKRLAILRPDEKPQRYNWFSSGNDVTDGRLYGCSSGTPIDVVKPEHVKSTTIFITEGHFKAQKIAETFHCLALSVQGVNTFVGIEIEIQRLIEQGYKITHIYLAYDADLSYKPSVFRSSQATMNLLTQYFPHLTLCYVGWDVNLGKGIDDLIEAGHQSRLSKLPRDHFEYLCSSFSHVLNESVNNWEESQLIQFYNQNILSHFPGYQPSAIS